MALIICKECGAKISDKAPSCPKCGTPLVPVGHVNLKITHTYNAWLIRKAKLYIYLNDKPFMECHYNQSYEFNIDKDCTMYVTPKGGYPGINGCTNVLSLKSNKSYNLVAQFIVNWKGTSEFTLKEEN